MDTTVPILMSRRPPRTQPMAGAVALADGLAALLHPFVEAVVHDLRTQRIVHIANNLSRRAVGDPTALEQMPIAPGESVIGPYAKRNWDGSPMRGITLVLRNERRRAVGLLCVNLATGAFAQARSVLDLLAAGAPVAPAPDRLFRDDWQEKVLAWLHAWLAERQLVLGALTRAQKREAVLALEAQGAFEGRGTAAYVARVLGMGRATVFAHLRDARLVGAGSR